MTALDTTELAERLREWMVHPVAHFSGSYEISVELVGATIFALESQARRIAELEGERDRQSETIKAGFDDTDTFYQLGLEDAIELARPSSIIANKIETFAAKMPSKLALDRRIHSARIAGMEEARAIAEAQGEIFTGLKQSKVALGCYRAADAIRAAMYTENLPRTAHSPVQTAQEAFEQAAKMVEHWAPGMFTGWTKEGLEEFGVEDGWIHMDEAEEVAQESVRNIAANVRSLAENLPRTAQSPVQTGKDTSEGKEAATAWPGDVGEALQQVAAADVTTLTERLARAEAQDTSEPEKRAHGASTGQEGA